MKKILKVLTMALMVFVLTGCMKLSINVEVKADKTMAMGMEILAEESMFKSAGMSADDYVKQMEDQIKSSEGMEDAKTTPIEKTDRKSTRLNSSHRSLSRMPSSA